MVQDIIKRIVCRDNGVVWTVWLIPHRNFSKQHPGSLLRSIHRVLGWVVNVPNWDATISRRQVRQGMGRADSVCTLYRHHQRLQISILVNCFDTATCTSASELVHADVLELCHRSAHNHPIA